MRINKSFQIKPAILVLLAVTLMAYACSRVEDNTRSGSLLVVNDVVGHVGDTTTGTGSTPLLSDTCENANDEAQDPELCTVVNDNATMNFSNEFLQIGPGIGQGPTFLNDIIVNRYRVDYFRSSGRNTPGIDVPFGIDGTMNVRVAVGASSQGAVIVVRHESKREPPLSELDAGNSEGVITAQAEIKFFGQDLAGRTVSATGFLEIHFANYGEN